jgi:AsmA family protein
VSDRTNDSSWSKPFRATGRWAAAQSRRLRPAARAGGQWARERSGRIVPGVRERGRRVAAGAAGFGRKVRREIRHPSRKTIKWSIALLVLAIAVAVFLAVFDWNWFRGPIGRYASARTGREVRLEGDLHVKLFSWTPTATVNQLTIGHPKWMRPGKTAAIRRLTVSVKLVPLMMGRVEMPLVDLDRPRFDLFSDAQGRANWKLDSKNKKPSKLPAINNLIIRDGDIRFNDVKKQLTLTGTIQSSESTVGRGAGFSLKGRGTIKGNPFLLTVAGGPLINLRPGDPYRFSADVRAGATHLTAKAALLKPFDFGQIDADGTVSGSDLGRLYDLTGAALPNTPPYRLGGRMEIRGRVIDFPHFAGRVGDSDLRGTIKADNSGERPMVTANLVSRSLDFDDLAAVFGGPPSVGRGETASPEQVAEARRLRAEGRLLPDATLDAQKLRALDADVRFNATSVQAGRLPLRQVSFRVGLDKGLLVVDPMAFTFPRGKITGEIRLNGRGATPVTDVDVRLAGLGLEYLAPAAGGTVPIAGTMSGRAKLHGTGNSVRKAAASADGAMSVVVPQGRIREAFAELLGINLAPGLIQLLNKDQDKTNLRCAVGYFDVSNGVARSRRIVIDTNPVIVEGQGRISLIDETIDIHLDGKSKKLRIGHLMAPIRVAGSLSAPTVKPELGKAAPQIGVAVALGAIVSPLAAILPFVDPGLAKDANCSALLAGR